MLGQNIAPSWVKFGTPSGETMHHTLKSFQGATACLVWWSSDFTGRRDGKNIEFFVCLSVCLSVTHLSIIFCAHNFTMKALQYRNSFDAIG